MFNDYVMIFFTKYENKINFNELFNHRERLKIKMN